MLHRSSWLCLQTRHCYKSVADRLGWYSHCHILPEFITNWSYSKVIQLNNTAACLVKFHLHNKIQTVLDQVCFCVFIIIISSMFTSNCPKVTFGDIRNKHDPIHSTVTWAQVMKVSPSRTKSLVKPSGLFHSVNPIKSMNCKNWTWPGPWPSHPKIDRGAIWPAISRHVVNLFTN